MAKHRVTNDGVTGKEGYTRTAGTRTPRSSKLKERRKVAAPGVTVAGDSTWSYNHHARHRLDHPRISPMLVTCHRIVDSLDPLSPWNTLGQGDGPRGEKTARSEKSLNWVDIADGGKFILLANFDEGVKEEETFCPLQDESRQPGRRPPVRNLRRKPARQELEDSLSVSISGSCLRGPRGRSIANARLGRVGPGTEATIGRTRRYSWARVKVRQQPGPNTSEVVRFGNIALWPDWP